MVHKKFLYRNRNVQVGKEGRLVGIFYIAMALSNLAVCKEIILVDKKPKTDDQAPQPLGLH